MLSLLQGCRGFAALLVVLYHTGGIVGAYWGSEPWLHAFDFGQAGVQFFFVLSGFIIYYVHYKDLGTGNLRSYLEKRLIRVFPVYILVTLALAPFWLFVPSFGEPYHKSVTALVFSMLLIPQDHAPHLGVAWTLIHEMAFYLVFSTLILSRVAGRAVFVIWFAAIVVANIALRCDLTFPADYYLSANNLLFGFGMLAAYLVIHRPHMMSVSTFRFGTLLFLATGVAWDLLPDLSPIGKTVLILFFGLASFLIVLSATQPELDRAFRKYRVVQLLGDASYSIYLIHYPILSMANKLLLVLDGSPPKPVIFILLALVATTGGVLLHLFIEKPLLSFCRARVVGRGYRLHPEERCAR